MPFIPAANVCRVSIEYNVGSLSMANVLHMGHSAGVMTAQEAEDIATSVKEIWAGEVMPLLVDDCVLNTVTVTDLTTETAAQGSWTGTVAGTSTALPTPPNIAVCVSVRTSLRSRNGRGRIYLPGIPEEQVDGQGTITGAYRTAVVSAFNDVQTSLLAEPDPGPIVMGVLSQYDGVDGDGKPIPRANGLFTAATGFAVDPTIDTQRRRLRN